MENEYKTSEARRRATSKYDKSIARQLLRMPASEKQRVEEHIKKTGESFNGFVKRAISETIERDNATL